jgi:putative endonuclease
MSIAKSHETAAIARPWTLYLIQTATGSLYTGITLDVRRRFNEHQAQSTKTAKALRGKAPLTVVYCAQLAAHGDALRAEMWVKKQGRKTKLALIAGVLRLPFEHEVLDLAVVVGDTGSGPV